VAFLKEVFGLTASIDEDGFAVFELPNRGRTSVRRTGTSTRS
jgi:hypothetical protein